MSLMAEATGPQGYQGRYTCDPRSATQARHDVTMILSTWHLEQLAPDASQVIAELMANAVSHCVQQYVVMEMRRTPSGVRIAVCDSCKKAPAPRDAAPTDENGRGIALIEAFASTWGWEFLQVSSRQRPVGKRVWAELNL